uniref:Uncharacterized protein n=1 Tax=Vitis vinifera TaxID=29760 RepID=F6I3B1_VITVI
MTRDLYREDQQHTTLKGGSRKVQSQDVNNGDWRPTTKMGILPKPKSNGGNN